MYRHLQQMSIRFFTDTKSGEVISRFSSDVVGAQSAITGTIPDILTNVVTLVSTLLVMLSIQWQLTIISVLVLPFFVLPARYVARRLRVIRRRAMEYNADMSSQIAETLSVNGALLTKTFGRQDDEMEKFRVNSASVRDMGIKRADVSQIFFVGIGLVTVVGTALVYWIGGYMVIQDAMSVGTIVAFAAYLARLYGPLSSLSNVQVEFASSMVSFERVFDYLDMPIEIQDQPGASKLDTVAGRIGFEQVSFRYLRSLCRARRQRWTKKTPPLPCCLPKRSALLKTRGKKATARENTPVRAPGYRVRHRAGHAGGPGGAERRRQDDHHLPAAPPLRPERRPHHPRRP